MQEYYDRMILTLREKYRQEQTEQMEGNEDEAWEIGRASCRERV